MSPNISTPYNESVLVASGNQSFATTGGLYTTSGSAGLADGQLAIVSWDPNGTVTQGNFLSATNGPGAAANTTSSVSAIRIVQGNANSADYTNLNGYSQGYKGGSYVSSETIKGNTSLILTGVASSVGKHSAWTVGDLDAGGNNVTLTDNTEYSFNIVTTGRRVEKRSSLHNSHSIPFTFETPNYTTLSLTDDTDHFYQNVAHIINLHSAAVKLPTTDVDEAFVAFAVNFEGGAGAGSGNSTAASTSVYDVINGAVTSIPLITINGTTYNFAVTAALINTLTESVANGALRSDAAAANDSTIELVNITTAGSADNVNGLVIVSLDNSLAEVDDRETVVRTRIQFGPNDEWNTDGFRFEETSLPREDIGSGRYLQIKYFFRAEKNHWSLQTEGYTRNFLRAPSWIDPTLTYNVYTIMSRDDYETGSGTTQRLVAKTHILVPSNAAGASASNTLTSLTTILAPWLASATLETVETPAASPTFFV